MRSRTSCCSPKFSVARQRGERFEVTSIVTPRPPGTHQIGSHELVKARESQNVFDASSDTCVSYRLRIRRFGVVPQYWKSHHRPADTSSPKPLCRAWALSALPGKWFCIFGTSTGALHCIVTHDCTSSPRRTDPDVLPAYAGPVLGSGSTLRLNSVIRSCRPRCISKKLCR